MKFRLPALSVLLPFAMLVVALPGCSWTGSVFSSDKVDYQSVQSRPTLEVPPDLSQLPRDERFVVPDRPQVITASGSSQTRPAPAATLPGTATVASAATVAVAQGPNGGTPVARIERAGNQRWLVVNMSAEKVWPVVLDFWPSVGLNVETQDAKVGVMDTNWAENRAKLPQDIIRRTLGKVVDGLYSTGEQDKYHTRIERTGPNTSEVYISHRGVIEVYTNAVKDQTIWQPRPEEPEMEAEMLQRLQLRFENLGQPQVTASATQATSGAGATSVVAAAPPIAQDVRLIKSADGHNDRLEIDEAFDRAWRRVGLALDRGGFTVEDRDRANGVYFVRYLDPEYEAKQKEAQGFFTKMFASDKPIPAQQFRVAVETHGGAKTNVQVLSNDGKRDQSVTGDRILSLLSEQFR